MVNYEWPGVTANCGGGGRIGERLADGLRERGHGVTVVTDTADGHYATFPFRSFRRLNRIIRDKEPDVIHGQFALPSSLFLPRLATKHELPLAVTVMGADIHDPTRYTQLRPVIDAAARRVLTRADAVIAPSRDLQYRTENTHGVDTSVIHYGIDASEWSWRKRTAGEQLNVLTVCRLVERKNLEGVMEAISAARTRGMDVKWTLVGTGPMEKRLREKWEDVEWLSMPGFVENLESTYASHDLFFLPSHHEGFGIVYLEALASGLPVVASDNGGQTDIITDGVGVTAPPGDVDALRRGLDAVWQEYPAYQRATKSYVFENFSRQQMVTDYESQFESMIA